jgi:hypothetical protein
VYTMKSAFATGSPAALARRTSALGKYIADCGVAQYWGRVDLGKIKVARASAESRVNDS